jgi:hypothetical protein
MMRVEGKDEVRPARLRISVGIPRYMHLVAEG